MFAWLTLRDSNPPLAEAFRIGVIILVVLPLVLALVGLGMCVVCSVGFGARIRQRRGLTCWHSARTCRCGWS